MAGPHPDCDLEPTECRITTEAWVAGEPQEWTPVYDGAGALTNSDPNIHVQQYVCATCGRTWGDVNTGGPHVEHYDGAKQRGTA